MLLLSSLMKAHALRMTVVIVVVVITIQHFHLALLACPVGSRCR